MKIRFILLCALIFLTSGCSTTRGRLRIVIPTQIKHTRVVATNFHGLVPGTYVPVQNRTVYRRCSACGMDYPTTSRHSCRIRVKYRGNLNTGRRGIDYRHREPARNTGPRYIPPRGGRHH